MRSFFIVLLSLLFGMNAALAGGGYPMQYCDDVTSPTTCYYVTSTGLPITPSVGSIYTVSATTDLNLSGNRIFTHADIVQLGGVPINLGTGAISTGTQRFTLATDDPAVVDLAAIEALLVNIWTWDDGSAHAQLDIAVQSLMAVKVSSTADANTAANPIFVQTSDGTNANALATPEYVGISDGTTLAEVLATHADGLALASPSLKSASIVYGYNGATLDMGRVGASKEWQMTDIATRAGEDAANDYRKTAKYYSEGYSPAKTTTADVVSAESTVLASVEILNYPNVCVYLANTDDADPFTDADIYVSPDGTTWIDLGWTSCDTLAFGEMCVYCFSNHAYRYVKAGVKADDTNKVNVDAFLTGNRN